VSSALRRQVRLPTPSHRLLAALSGILCGALYLRTMAPTVMWYDMGEMTTAAYFLGIAHNTGYPLYVLLGKLFTFLPIGDIAYRVNLMSAFFATGTVIVVYQTIWELTNQRGTAFVAALTLGCGSTLWANATYAESYTLNAFFVSLLGWLVIRAHLKSSRRPLHIAFYLLGLAMGNHHLIQFFGPGLLAYWYWYCRQHEKRLPWRELIGLAGLFALGFAINLFLPFRAAQNPPVMWADASDWPTFFKMVTTGMQRREVFVSPTAGAAYARLSFKTAILFPAYEFTLLALGLALWGGVRLWRQDRPLLIFFIPSIVLVFFMILFYRIHNIFQYFLPIYVVLAVWLGVGLARLKELLGDIWRQRFPLSADRRFIGLLLTIIALGLPVHLVGRDFAVLDRSQDFSTYDLAYYLAHRLEPDAIVLADFWTWAPLAYYQSIGGWRPDVTIRAALSERDVDWPQTLNGYLKTGKPLYAITGLELPSELVEQAYLQPIGLNVVETMPGLDVPRPSFKDVWLPRGDLFRVYAQRPQSQNQEDREVFAEEPVLFEGGVSLLRFSANPRVVRKGRWATFTYCWQLSQPAKEDLYASVQFLDTDGQVHVVRGLPVWQQAHTIGVPSGTSEWQTGKPYCEVYDTLVPWRVSPGSYTIHMWLYDSPQKQRERIALSTMPSGAGISLGELRVLEGNR